MLAYISACRGVIGFKVATWLCPVREKVRPARPDVCVSAKKFAPHAQNGRKTLFSGALGELFRGNAAGGPRWANFVAHADAPAHVRSLRCPPCLQWWGFCTTRSRRTACRRRVGPSCSAIPPAAQCRIRFCACTGFALCVDGCAHLVAALQECHRFAGVCAAYPASFVSPDTLRNPGPGCVDHLYHHTPVTLSEHPTTWAANQLVARLNIEYQSIWGASHAR